MQEAMRDLNDKTDQVNVIPMGVDLQHRFTPPVERLETGVILFVGRLVEKKGLRYLIEALPSILDKHPQSILRIVGDGQEKELIKERIKELNLSQHVEFRGAVSNKVLPAIYRTADVVVFPSVISGNSDREGFGLVLVEALGCGCAAVVTDLPAMHDIVEPGKSAHVVPQKDPAQIAKKVCLLLEDVKLCQTMGRQGRAYVLQKFDWEIITGQYKELIHSVKT
jgi:glycosyltransferase involved in cell wall biosynthesis